MNHKIPPDKAKRWFDQMYSKYGWRSIEQYRKEDKTFLAGDISDNKDKSKYYRRIK